MSARSRFVVATPNRTVCDDNARALEAQGLLRFLALGTRRGTAGIPPERTRLNPWIGLCGYASGQVLSQFREETFRFALLPWFDRWVKRQLEPGDHLLSSYGYVNECFAWVRAHGGKTFVDAGNSHPEAYWAMLEEEYARWQCPLPPFPRNWYRRSLAMMPLVDYVLSPSAHVTRSFLARGFRPEQILRNVYPIDLRCFTPAREPRAADRPLTIISTGAPSLRKGTPYLLEAYRLVRRAVPAARLILNDGIHDSFRPLLASYSDLPIQWIPRLPHAELAAQLQQADVFVLPSLEEGMARTALEAMACGLPCVLTEQTGSAELMTPGVHGTVVPIRDPAAIAAAILEWWARIEQGGRISAAPIHEPLRYDTFAESFLRQLAELGLIATAEGVAP
jgi:glycosyltransferase involved in cell wall biosynthesis